MICAVHKVKSLDLLLSQNLLISPIKEIRPVNFVVIMSEDVSREEHS
jgi:hypothetical protein